MLAPIPRAGRRVALAAALLLPAAHAATAHAATAVSTPPRWAVDGTISALAASGPRLAVGGDFARIGRYTGTVAIVDGRGGGVRGGLAAVVGEVDAAIDDGLGGVVVGASEELVARAARGRSGTGRLLHLRADGSVVVLPDLPASALARSGSTIVVAGPADAGTRLLGLDARSDRRVFDATTPVEVIALAGDAAGVVAAVAPGSTLARIGLADGRVARFGPTLLRRPSGVALDGDRVWTWGLTDEESPQLVLARRLDGKGLKTMVYVGERIAGVVRRGTAVLVGGAFTRIANRERSGLALFNRTTGALLATPIAGASALAGIDAVGVAPDGAALAAAATGGERVVALRLAGGQTLARPSGAVTAILRSGKRLVLVGRFAAANAVDRPRVAILARRGAALAGGVALPAAALLDQDLAARGLAWSGPRLWVGMDGGDEALGPVLVVDPRRHGRIVAQPLGRVSRGADAVALVGAGGSVWAAGELPGRVPVAAIASTPPFRRTFTARSCACDAVALARDGDGVAVSGNAGIGRWGSAFTPPLAAGAAQPAIAGAVDLEHVGADLIAAGEQTADGAVVARVDGEADAVRWSVDATSLDGSAGIEDVAVIGDRVVVAGSFDTLGGRAAPGLGLLDAADGTPLAFPVPGGLPATPLRVASTGAGRIAVALDDGTIVSVALP